MRVGIEIGGTFTDLICIDNGRARVTKVPSTPSNPEIGFSNAVLAAGLDLSEVKDLVHGSTVATNAVVERKGARVLLVTTQGFRDILWIQRQDRARSYELVYRKPEPVVARGNVVEIEERIAADGSIALDLDATAARAALRQAVVAINPEVIAVALLNAYANPVHERLLQQIISDIAPKINVLCSHTVSPEFREYERTSTTVLSAYIQPVVDRYLQGIQRDLVASGFSGRFSVMQSNGGRLPALAMRGHPITALFSGPAAGAIGASRLARAAGYENVITFDMGGTSADVCLVTGGKPSLKPLTRVEGLPVRTPVLDIATVGAGGGSIIWRDDGGMLRAGPQSSGADPGPACYGRGGVRPTITDAHAVCGTLRPERFLGGKAKIDVAAARLAFADLAKEFGLSIEEIADSAIRVANANVVRAIQAISTEVGKDPRTYALMGFGGAGPLHAARIAEGLNVREVVIPLHAGVLSAFGLLASDFTVYETATRRISVTEQAPAVVRETISNLRNAAQNRLIQVGVQGPFFADITLQMRYVGQAFELDVPVAESDLDAIDQSRLRRLYETVASEQFQRPANRSAAIEIVGFRCGVTAVQAGDIDMDPASEGGGDAGDPCDIYEDRERHRCQVVPWPREDGAVLIGPAIIDAGTSTVYVPPHWQAHVRPKSGCLIMQKKGAPN